MAEAYDFIIVGAGISGSLLASRLAKSPAQPSVLLLEAGGTNENAAHLSGAERFKVAFDPSSGLNWNYKTEPQNQLSGNIIDYSRGRGLGGSSSINFCAWTTGPRDDYEEWARLVGDEEFGWANAKKYLDGLVNLHPEIPHEGMKKYLQPRIEDHNTSGPIDVSYGEGWLLDLPDLFAAAEDCGLKTNKDINDGDPLGLGMGTVSIFNGVRGTSASIFLQNPSHPPNLSIVTNALVEKVVFEGKKATGVKTADGKTYHAKKEVVLSGGALNTPQILMLSGIGPADELQQHGIPILHEMPLLGQTLQDHCMSSAGIIIKRNPKDPIQAMMQTPSPMGFFQSEAVYNSAEYKALDPELRKFMEKSTVPHFELCMRLLQIQTVPPSFLGLSGDFGDDKTYLGGACIVDLPQSRGTVTLKSADPYDKPKMDPKFLTHSFDRRVMIEGVKQVMRLLSTPVLKDKTVQFIGPADESDEAVWEHVRRNLSSSWHMSCTASMGKAPEDSCVDSNFRVFGLDALRVVDLSVCPFVPNNHTQSTAYVVGEIAATKLIREYGLRRN